MLAQEKRIHNSNARKGSSIRLRGSIQIQEERKKSTEEGLTMVEDLVATTKISKVKIM